jgi:hypothetical protein
MKMRNLFIIIVMLACAVISSGCGRIESFGEHISDRNITPIKDIVSHPEQFIGKPVTVKGVIAVECNTGCWFNLKDGAAVIYTDINPSGFAIPQKVGHNAVVEGTVSVVEGRLTLTGKAVEIQ